MLLSAIHTIHIIKYWSIAFVPLAFLLFVRPCRLKVRAQAIWLMVLLACGMKGFVYESFGGNAMAPDLPELIVWIWNWADSGLFFLVALSLVWWVRRGRAFILPALAWGIAAWGQYNGTVPPSVNEIELSFPGLPASLEGYRIAQVSDLHCSSAARGWRTRAVVRQVNDLKPDLICLTGDYVDGKVADLDDDLAPLKELRARDGVYGVRGNHEYYTDRIAWRKWFRKNGFSLLANTCVFPHAGLALGGVNDDQSAQRFRDVRADVGRAFAAATNGEFRVLMEHRPIFAVSNAVEHAVDLQLSGHTHGGVAPLIFRVVSRYNRGYVRGIYRIGSMKLCVSPGCGQWVGFPIRFFNPAEITVITLRKGEGK